mgnify:FL=1
MGYFPTYTLGAVAAAQLYEKAEAELGGGVAVAADIKKGDFSRIKAWLNANVHARGAKDESLDALLVAATGSPLTAVPFLRGVAKKYGALYALDPAAVDAALAPALARAEAAVAAA